MSEFFSNIDFMQYLWCFIIGGVLCIIAQILIDKTKLTPARILVLYVTVGTILGGLGLYKYLVDFAEGAIEGVKDAGIIGAFTGGVKAAAGGIAAAVFFGYIASLISKPKIKKQ